MRIVGESLRQQRGARHGPGWRRPPSVSHSAGDMTAGPLSPIEPPIVPLSALTTLRVGGPPERMIAPRTELELVADALEVWDRDDDWLLVGGGSNTVTSDKGFEGTVIRLVTRGIEQLDVPQQNGTVRLRVQAGEPWDNLVAYTVDQGWTGIEALSGIPGCCGAAPVQNIGAYGQELSESLVAVHLLDFETRAASRVLASELKLGYRTSRVKAGLVRGIILAIELDVFEDGAGSAGADESSALSQPVAYGQLATTLGVRVGERVPLADLRRAVLALRASKGMVLDAADPDSVSAGSFFTNPIVSEDIGRSLPAAAPRWPADSRVKLSAAWLIERSGIMRGFALPGSRAAISSKHTLALINRGGATAAEIVELARFVQGRVQAEFGVVLQPEPVLVGVAL